MGVLGKESPILGNAAPQKRKIGRIGHPPESRVQGDKCYRNRVPMKFARRVHVCSACVDIRPSPKTDVLVLRYIKYTSNNLTNVKQLNTYNSTHLLHRL